MKNEGSNLSIEDLKQVDDRISKIAEDDPLGALFIIKNLKIDGGLDEKPLVAKIILVIAEKLDMALRHHYTEKARIMKSLLLKLIDELDVKDIYGQINIPIKGELPDSESAEESKDELLEEIPLDKGISLFKNE